LESSTLQLYIFDEIFPTADFVGLVREANPNPSFCLFRVGVSCSYQTNKDVFNYTFLPKHFSSLRVSNKKKFVEKECLEIKLQLIQYVVFSSFFREKSKTPHIG
jgi:hypothetical protein